MNDRLTAASGDDPDDPGALRRLAERYAAFVDRLDIASVAELFIPDGVLGVPATPGGLAEPAARRGRQAIFTALGSLDRYESTFHEVVGHVLEPSTTSQAHGPGAGIAEQGGQRRGVTTCEAHHFSATDGRLVDRVMGIHYQDRYAIFQGRWHFAERHLEVSWLDERPLSAVRTRAGEWLTAAR